jgi:hypothetical protein
MVFHLPFYYSEKLSAVEVQYLTVFSLESMMSNNSNADIILLIAMHSAEVKIYLTSH